jgi:hypothetical protein
MTDDVSELFARIRLENVPRPCRRRKRRPRRGPAAERCDYIKLCRSLAYQESMALRAFARQGRLPKCSPVDYWRAWQDQIRGTSSTTFKKKAA